MSPDLFIQDEEPSAADVGLHNRKRMSSRASDTTTRQRSGSGIVEVPVQRTMPRVTTLEERHGIRTSSSGKKPTLKFSPKPFKIRRVSRTTRDNKRSASLPVRLQKSRASSDEYNTGSSSPAGGGSGIINMLEGLVAKSRMPFTSPSKRFHGPKGVRGQRPVSPSWKGVNAHRAKGEASESESKLSNRSRTPTGKETSTTVKQATPTSRGTPSAIRKTPTSKDTPATPKPKSSRDASAAFKTPERQVCVSTNASTGRYKGTANLHSISANRTHLGTSDTPQTPRHGNDEILILSPGERGCPHRDPSPSLGVSKRARERRNARKAGVGSSPSLRETSGKIDGKEE
ncbi:MAG: hypothetical protein Q9218_003622, partial [Villophora microphyllina]